MASSTSEPKSAHREVACFIRYSAPDADGGYIEGNGVYSFGMEDHPAVVRNARLAETSWETHGFTLLEHSTDVDFADREDVENRYYPEVGRLVRELTGASEAFVFLGILRGGEEAASGGPALSAHVDFNEAALRDWVRRLAPDRADELASKRLMNVNVWRGVRPVENMPLAVCDARSVEKDDFMRVALGKPEGGFRDDMAAGLNMAHNPKHEWYYFPDMQPGEALAFRLFDTANAEWKMTGHTAFEDPTSRPGSPKRQSFEVRTIAVFDA